MNSSVLSLGLRFLLKSRAVDDLHLAVLNFDQTLSAEPTEIPGDHLANGSKARRQFLVGGWQVEALRASLLRCVQKHSCQALGNAPKGHGFDQPHQLSQPSPDYGQNFQRDVRVLPAELLKV